MALIDQADDMPMDEESKGMEEREIASIVRAEIDHAIGYSDSEYETDRTHAIQYYQGTMHDTPAEKGRSQVVSYDVADTIGEVMPSLMRVFFSGGNIVEYEPGTPEELEQSEQASDYVSHFFMKRCDGYNVLWDAFHDGLLHRNGVVTYFYDSKPTFGVHEYTQLTEDQLTALGSDPEVEILEASQGVTEIIDPQNQLVQIPVFDVRIRRVKERGCIKVMAVPPEEFLINREATCIADARFCARRYLTTRSDLRLEGYDPEVIDRLSQHSELETTETVVERLEENYAYPGAEQLDESQQEVQVYDCYVRIDSNGDGIAEWMHIVMGANAGSEDSILLIEEWHEDVPFTDLTPERVPHRWQGRSIYDQMKDIQQIKTVITRATLDSCYQSNNPDEFVNESVLVDPDELLTRELGRRVRVRGNPHESIMAHQLPFIGNHTFPMLEHLDSVAARRTGINPATAALDPEVLQNQSATAANLAASMQYSKIELIARNYSEQLRRMFRALLKLVVENADRREIIRLRGKFVEFNPRSWNADMDCEVNIGLGTGSRDRDMAMLQAVAMDQDKYLDNLGPNNPYVPLESRVETSRRIAEAGGLKKSEMFFAEPTPEQVEQFKQQQAEQANKLPPEEMAKVQLEQAKMQGARDKEMAQMQADLQVEQARMQSDSQQQAEKLQADTLLNQQKIEFEREKLDREDIRHAQDLNAKIRIEMAKLRASQNKDLDELEIEDLELDALGGGNQPSMRDIVSSLSAVVQSLNDTMSRPKRNVIVRDEKGDAVGIEQVID